MLSYKLRENKTCVKPRSCKLQPLPVDLKTSTNARTPLKGWGLLYTPALQTARNSKAWA